MIHAKLNIIKSFALAVSVLIVLNLFFNMGVKTFYPVPEFEEFCPASFEKKYESKGGCEDVGGNWIDTVGAHPKYAPERPMSVPINGEFEFVEYCDAYHTCREEHTEAVEFYERNVFIILIIAGFIALGIGFQMSAVVALSSGFVWGGVLSLLVGAIRYWSGMQDYLRFVILAVVLAVLVLLGYKKMNK